VAEVHGTLGDVAPDIEEPARLRAAFEALRSARARGWILSYHDRSTAARSSRRWRWRSPAAAGLELCVEQRDEDPLAPLFSEELGFLLQVRDADVPAVRTLFAEHGLGPDLHALARPVAGDTIRIRHGDALLAELSRATLFAAWHETTHAMQRLRDNPECADQERASVCDPDDPGLAPALSFDAAGDVAAPYLDSGAARASRSCASRA
jgi:phosphoribosylformylglycinamidine synthase